MNVYVSVQMCVRTLVCVSIQSPYCSALQELPCGQSGKAECKQCVFSVATAGTPQTAKATLWLQGRVAQSTRHRSLLGANEGLPHRALLITWKFQKHCGLKCP